MGFQVTTIVPLFGCTANCLTLTYYLLHEREGLTKRLFILLNMWDFVSCLTYTVRVWVGDEELKPLFLSVVYNTCFITILLSVTRAIMITIPFYLIKGKYVGVSLAAVFLYSMTVKLILSYEGEVLYTGNRKLDGWQVANICEGTFWTITFLITVLISNILSITKLLWPGTVPLTSGNVNAAKTVIIISTILVLSNGIFLLYIARNIKYIINDGSRVKLIKGYDIKRGAKYFQLLTILTSVCNPIVYFIRKKELRIWVFQFPRSVRSLKFDNFARKLTRTVSLPSARVAQENNDRQTEQSHF